MESFPPSHISTNIPENSAWKNLFNQPCLKKNKQENEPTNKNPQRSLEKTASGLDIRREETPALPTHSQLAQSLLQQ